MSRIQDGHERRYSRLVTKDTGVVDDHIDTAPLVDDLLDNLVTLSVRVVVGDSLATGLGDFFYDDIGGLLVLVLGRRAQIVDEDLCSASSEEEGVSVVPRAGRKKEKDVTEGVNLGVSLMILAIGNKRHNLQAMLTSSSANREKNTYALPRPFPAPVTTKTRPLNEILPFSVEGKSDILEGMCAELCG